MGSLAKNQHRTANQQSCCWVSLNIAMAVHTQYDTFKPGACHDLAETCLKPAWNHYDRMGLAEHCWTYLPIWNPNKYPSSWPCHHLLPHTITISEQSRADPEYLSIYVGINITSTLRFSAIHLLNHHHQLRQQISAVATRTILAEPTTTFNTIAYHWQSEHQLPK